MRSFADLCLRSFALICVFLRPTAFRTTEFGERLRGNRKRGNRPVSGEVLRGKSASERVCEREGFRGFQRFQISEVLRGFQKVIQRPSQSPSQSASIDDVGSILKFRVGFLFGSEFCWVLQVRVASRGRY